jgi:hypothetical protein
MCDRRPARVGNGAPTRGAGHDRSQQRLRPTRSGRGSANADRPRHPARLRPQARCSGDADTGGSRSRRAVVNVSFRSAAVGVRRCVFGSCPLRQVGAVAGLDRRDLGSCLQRGFRALRPGPAGIPPDALFADGFVNVDVGTSTFENWDDRGSRFHVLVAASAWHRVNPSIGWQRAHDVLHPGGSIALAVPGPDRDIREPLLDAIDRVSCCRCWPHKRHLLWRSRGIVGAWSRPPRQRQLALYNHTAFEQGVLKRMW